MSNTKIERRTVIAGISATLIGCGAPTLALAGSSESKRLKVGDIAVTAISDGHFDLPGNAFERDSAMQIADTVRVGATVWAIETPRRVLLVDAGSGETLKSNYPATGQLASRLAAAGIDRKTVSDIIITHMHADHIGGLVNNGAKLFPAAGLHMAGAEWRYWTAADRPSRLPSAQKGLALLIQRLAGALPYDMMLHEGEADLGDGVSLVPAPGHTPGHMAVRISAGSGQLLLLGDLLIAGDIQFSHPGATYVLDSDPALAVQTRRKFFDMIAADDLAFCATHLNGLGSSKLRRSGEGFEVLG